MKLLSAKTLLLLFGAAAARDWKYSLGWDGTITESEPWQVIPFVGERPGSATAVASASNPKRRSTPGGVYVCTDNGFSGVCQYFITPLGTCFQVAICKQNQISSFAPDPGASCYGWATTNCSGNTWWGAFTYPGDGSGGYNSGNIWDNQINSWACF